MNTEGPLLRLKNHGSDHIAGQKIGGKLNSFKIQPHGRPQTFDQEGFGQPRQSLQQNVTVG